MTDYVAYFLDSAPNVFRIETLEISHPSFSRVYRVQTEVAEGIELGGEFYEYVPLEISPRPEQNDLESGFAVTFGDLGEILPAELDRVQAAGTWGILPQVVYRQFRSDDTSGPMLGPEVFEMRGLNFTEDGATFDASARPLNLNRTGEVYTITRFPMLAGFLT